MDKIEWCDLPEPRHATGKGKGLVQTFVEALKQRPGAWAKYPGKCSKSTAYNCKARFQGTEWAKRKSESGELEVYARWVGP